MSIYINLLQKFWESNEKMDKKRMSTQILPSGIEEITNIPYIDDNDKYHLLDVYFPENTKSPLPVIIDIHGGGWMYGDKELNKNYCQNLAKRGFTVFNISYRLFPNATVDEELCDVSFALKWISENIKDFPCDDEKIMITGDSAGGELALYSAVLMKSEKLREIFNTEKFSLNILALTLTSPVAFMNKCGIMGLYTRVLWGKNYKEKRTYNFMDFDNIIDFADDFMPSFFITSSGDIIARKATHKAEKLLKSKGFETKIADFGKSEGKSLPHVFSVLFPDSLAGKEAIDMELEFFKKAMKKEKSRL